MPISKPSVKPGGSVKADDRVLVVMTLGLPPLKPAEALFKVGVIAAADRMNLQAANAFLKTLEEPPGKSILVLLTTAPQRLLETILSRCLRQVLPLQT